MQILSTVNTPSRDYYNYSATSSFSQIAKSTDHHSTRRSIYPILTFMLISFKQVCYFTTRLASTYCFALHLEIHIPRKHVYHMYINNYDLYNDGYWMHMQSTCTCNSRLHSSVQHWNIIVNSITNMQVKIKSL